MRHIGGIPCVLFLRGWCKTRTWGKTKCILDAAITKCHHRSAQPQEETISSTICADYQDVEGSYG